MTLEDKMNLISDLVREDRDTTIRQYLDTVDEIENIEKNITMAYPGITPEQRDNIIRMATTMTAKDIRRQTHLAFSTIYAALRKANIDVKADTRLRRMLKKREEEAKKEMEELERLQLLEARRKAAEKIVYNKPEPIVRPAAVYSNHSPFGIAS